MSSEQPVYKPGDQVNGYVFTGDQWLPVVPQKSGWKFKTWEVVLLTLVVVLPVIIYSLAALD